MEKLFNEVSIILGFLGGLIISFLGGWDGLAITLVSFICFDYITGLLKACYNKELNSYKGFKGILKKVVVLIVVGVSVLLEEQMGIPAIREIVMMFFIANEGISLLENVSQMGVPFPEKVKEVLLQIRSKGE